MPSVKTCLDWTEYLWAFFVSLNMKADQISSLIQIEISEDDVDDRFRLLFQQLAGGVRQ